MRSTSKILGKLPKETALLAGVLSVGAVATVSAPDPADEKTVVEISTSENASVAPSTAEQSLTPEPSPNAWIMNYGITSYAVYSGPNGTVVSKTYGRVRGEPELTDAQMVMRGYTLQHDGPCRTKLDRSDGFSVQLLCL